MKFIKNLLIILVVLLVLLILISTFGGSIRVHEKYTDVSPDMKDASQDQGCPYQGNDFALNNAVASKDMPLAQAPLPVGKPDEPRGSCAASAIAAPGAIDGYDQAAVAFDQVEFGEPASKFAGVAAAADAMASHSMAKEQAEESSIEAFDGNLYAPSALDA